MSEPDIYTIKLADNEPEQFVKHTDYMKLHYSWKEMFADGIQVLRQERDEMAKLKADNERLTENIEKLCKHGDLEIERLKAEVERLRKFNDEAMAHIAKEERKSRDRLDMAQADIERLCKAGDVMLLALWLGVDEYSKEQKEKAEEAWNAAKEEAKS